MKKYLILVFLASLLLFTGCEEQQKESTTLETEAFIGGDEGLGLSFVEGAPPEEVYDQGKFPFAVNLQIENKGEWDITNPQDVEVKISGIDPADFNNPVLQKNVEQALYAKRKDLQGTIIEGTIATVTFPDLNYMGTLTGDATFNLRAGVCYAYGTKASTKVCIKEDLLSIDETGCIVNEQKPVSNSGAPVEIKDVKESAVASNKLSLTFKIVHNGKGNVHKPGTGCDTGIENKNKVYLVVDSGVTPGAECSGLTDSAGNPTTGSEGYVKLFNNERVITCSQQIPTPGNFEKLLDFTITYDYSQYLDKEITVKHVG